jgi:hypothetical protein
MANTKFQKIPNTELTIYFMSSQRFEDMRLRVDNGHEFEGDMWADVYVLKDAVTPEAQYFFNADGISGYWYDTLEQLLAEHG